LLEISVIDTLLYSGRELF